MKTSALCNNFLNWIHLGCPELLFFKLYSINVTWSGDSKLRGKKGKVNHCSSMRGQCVVFGQSDRPHIIKPMVKTWLAHHQQAPPALTSLHHSV